LTFQPHNGMAQRQRRGWRDTYSIFHHFWQADAVRSGAAAVRREASPKGAGAGVRPLKLYSKSPSVLRLLRGLGGDSDWPDHHALSAPVPAFPGRNWAQCGGQVSLQGPGQMRHICAELLDGLVEGQHFRQLVTDEQGQQGIQGGGVGEIRPHGCLAFPVEHAGVDIFSHRGKCFSSARRCCSPGKHTAGHRSFDL
jgi:hypothetical protein